MQFVFISALALAMGASAQTAGFDVMSIPAEQETYAVGSSLPITWTPGSSTGTISLTLIGGSGPSSLSPIIKIASGIDSTAGTYPWLIPTNAGSFLSYGINLTLDADPNTFQYSNAFHITGGSSGGGSTSSTTASSSVSVVSTSTTTGTSAVTVTGSTTQVETSTSGSVTTGTATTGPTTLASTTKSNSTSSSVKSTGGSASGTSTSSAAASSSTSKTSDGDINIMNSKFALLGGLLVAFAL